MPVILEKVTGLPGFKGLMTLVVTTNYPSLRSFGRLYSIERGERPVTHAAR
jgi:hypothetical protein